MSFRPCFRAWRSWAAWGLILSFVSCEYNADLTVRVPRWETGLTPVGVLGVSPRPLSADGEGPLTASQCEEAFDRVALSFYLANERDDPVADGDRLRVGEALMRPTAEALLDPTDPEQTLFVDLLTLDTGSGDPIPLSGTVVDLVWRPAPAVVPPRLVLLHDHGQEAGERDASDERLSAWSELIQEALCQREPALGCRLPGDTRLSLYRLSGNAVAPLVRQSRNHDALQQSLDELREAGELGDAPLFTLADGVTPGGIPTALGECEGAGDEACWPAVVLITASDDPGAAPLSEASLPEGARLFAAGLTDSPALRRLACQTRGFFAATPDPADLRLITNLSDTDIPDYRYGFARQVLMAMAGHWEATLDLSGLPADLDRTSAMTLSGTLTVTLGTHAASSDFRVILGGY